MEDDDLKVYLPRKGDRVKVFEYCKKKYTSERESLVEKLKRKLSERNAKKSSDDVVKHPMRKSSIIKPDRKIHVGWICDGKQVRQKFGGGNTIISIDRQATKLNILDKAKLLFFPEGESPKGSKSSFTFDLLDFKQNSLDNDLTIDQMYAITGLTNLRFYLSTVSKCDDTLTDIDENNKEESVIEKLHKAILPTDCTYYYEVHPSEDLTHNNGLSFQLFTNLDASEMDNLFATHTDSESLPTYVEEQHSESGEIQEICESEHEPQPGTEATSTVMLALPKVKLILHRGQIFNELLEKFANVSDYKTTFIKVEVISRRGKTEAALDGGGVFGDILTEFWNTFYNVCCEGTLWKIPVVNHLYTRKWKTIAEIMLVGFTQVKYFPNKLNRVFIEYCIIGFSKQALIEAYFKHIAPCDVTILKQAVNDFDIVPEEDLIDVLCNLQCKKTVCAENLQKVLTELVHTTLVQKPMYIIDCWSEVFSGTVLDFDIIDNAYNAKKITNKNVLERIVRFVTGADILIDNMYVEFCAISDFRKVPTAHCCSNLLVLPHTCDNYLELKTVFESVLCSNEWEMNLV